MEELLKRLFGIGEAQASPVQVFPVQDSQTVLRQIAAPEEGVTDLRIQPTEPQFQTQPQAQSQGFSLPSVQSLGQYLPSMSGVEQFLNKATTPNVPFYMQGLLGAEGEAALAQQAQKSGLLNAATALLAAGGPQPQKMSLGQILAGGIQGYQQGAQGTFDDTLKGLKIRSELAPKSNLTDDIKEYQFAVSQGYKGSFKEYLEGMKSAGAIKIMNEGQSGFDNELKVKNAFSGEPVYKGFQEMKSAYNQITDSIKQESPAGDLAAATKFMKLLDPGSVVRESELYMAMQASGALDRFVNYANMRISGEKLTPDQRKDFQSLADKLYQASINAYNEKRNEYAGIAQAYGLDPSRSVGKPITFSKQIKVDF